MINILIPEEIPSLNKGEAAILAGMLESFKLLADDVSVCMLSIYPEYNQQRYDRQTKVIDARGLLPSDMISGTSSAKQKLWDVCRCFSKHFMFFILHGILKSSATKIMRGKTWQAYCESDVVIICHDSLFYPLYHPIVALFSKFMKKVLVVYGATFNITIKHGRFRSVRSFLAKKIIKIVVESCDLVTVREEISYNLLREIGINSNSIYLTGDFPFLLRPAEDKRVQQILRAESLEQCPRIIGMSIVQHKLGIMLSTVKDDRKKREVFIDALVEVVNHLTGALDATVVFIPHCIGYERKRDDRIIASEIYEKTRQKERVHVITQEYPPEDLKGLIGRFQMFIGMRLHSVVDAVSMGVPSVMLTHQNDNRANGIVGKMLGQADWIYDMRELTAASLIEKTDELWCKRDQINRDLIFKVPHAIKQTLLNGELLARLIEDKKKKPA